MDKLTKEDLRRAVKAHYNRNSSSESETESDVERKCKLYKPPPRKFSFIRNRETGCSAEYNNFENKLLYDHNFPDVLRVERGIGVTPQIPQYFKQDKKVGTDFLRTSESTIKLKARKTNSPLNLNFATKTVNTSSNYEILNASSCKVKNVNNTNKFETQPYYHKENYAIYQEFYTPIEIVSVIMNSNEFMLVIKIFLGYYGMGDFIMITNNIPRFIRTALELKDEIINRVVHVLEKTETTNHRLQRDSNGYIICCPEYCYNCFPKNIDMQITDDHYYEDILLQRNTSWKYLKNAMMDYLEAQGNLFDPEAPPIHPRLPGNNMPNVNTFSNLCSGRSKFISWLYIKNIKKNEKMNNVLFSTSPPNLEATIFEKPDVSSTPLIDQPTVTKTFKGSKNKKRNIKKRKDTNSFGGTKIIQKRIKVNNDDTEVKSKLYVSSVYNTPNETSISNDKIFKETINDKYQPAKEIIHKAKELVPFDAIQTRFLYLDAQEIRNNRNLFIKNIELLYPETFDDNKTKVPSTVNKRKKKSRFYNYESFKRLTDLEVEIHCSRGKYQPLYQNFEAKRPEISINTYSPILWEEVVQLQRRIDEFNRIGFHEASKSTTFIEDKELEEERHKKDVKKTAVNKTTLYSYTTAAIIFVCGFLLLRRKVF